MTSLTRSRSRLVGLGGQRALWQRGRKLSPLRLYGSVTEKRETIRNISNKTSDSGRFGESAQLPSSLVDSTFKSFPPACSSLNTESLLRHRRSLHIADAPQALFVCMFAVLLCNLQAEEKKNVLWEVRFVLFPPELRWLHPRCERLQNIGKHRV